MEWFDFVRDTLERPGMWVSRPYVQGLTALWLGYSQAQTANALRPSIPGSLRLDFRLKVATATPCRWKRSLRRPLELPRGTV